MKVFLKSLANIIHRHRKILLLIIVVTLSIILLQTLISSWLSEKGNLYIPSIGTIHTLGVNVYGKDIQERDGEKFIDWGAVYPGSLVTRTFNVTSKSNVKGILIIKTANWTLYNSENKTVLGPADKIEYLGLLPPKYNMTVLAPNETLELTLTLNVTASSQFIDFILKNDVKYFSFDIHISLSEST